MGPARGVQAARRFTLPMPIHATDTPRSTVSPHCIRTIQRETRRHFKHFRTHSRQAPRHDLSPFLGSTRHPASPCVYRTKNCPSAAGKRGEVMSLRSRRLVCGTLPRRGYTVHRQFFTVQRRYSCANGSVLTPILLRHKNAWPWDASLDTCNSDETDSHASIINGNENRFRSFRLKKRDDKIIFGLLEKPDRENRLFFKTQFSKTFETETDSRFLIRTATWPKRFSHSFRRNGEKTLSSSTLPTTITLSGLTFLTAFRLNAGPLLPHR